MKLFAECVNREAKYETKFNNTLRRVAELNPTLVRAASAACVAKIAQTGFCRGSVFIVTLCIPRLGALKVQ